MKIRDLFHKKNSREVAERKLLFFGQPYESVYYHPYNGYYRCGRWFDGRICNLTISRLPVFTLVAFHKGEWN